MNGSSSGERESWDEAMSAGRRRAGRVKGDTPPGELTDTVAAVLREGMVIDIHAPVPLLGIGLATIDCRRVIWSAETFLSGDRLSSQAGRKVGQAPTEEGQRRGRVRARSARPESPARRRRGRSGRGRRR